MTDEERREGIIRVSRLLAEASKKLDQLLGYPAEFSLPISQQTLPEFDRVGALRKGLCENFFGGHDWRHSSLLTLGHLASLTEEEVLTIRNIGPRYLAKIKSALDSHGLALDDERARAYVAGLEK